MCVSVWVGMCDACVCEREMRVCMCVEECRDTRVSNVHMRIFIYVYAHNTHTHTHTYTHTHTHMQVVSFKCD